MIELGYFRIAEWRLMEWEQAYSPLNVAGELQKMKLWLDANPKRHKRNYQRFIVNWLNKAHAQVVVAQVNARHSSLCRQEIFTDQHGQRYKVSAEGSRQYIFGG